MVLVSCHVKVKIIVFRDVTPCTMTNCYHYLQGCALVNSDPEVRSGRMRHDAELYHFARPDHRIRITSVLF